MDKEEILKKVKEIKEMLEMDAEEFAKIYGKKFNVEISKEVVYAFRTGVATAMLDNILL